MLKTEPDSVDIHKTSSITNAQSQVYDTLFKMDNEGNIIPGLVEDYTVENNGKEVTFYLKEGATFHSGELVTAEAIKLSMERFLETSPFYDNAGEIKDIEIIDEYTFKLYWSEQYAPFFSNATSAYLSPLDTSVLNESGDGFESNPSGSGPFKITEINRGDSIEYEVFDNFDWGEEGRPNFDHLKYRFISDEETRVLEFRQGNINVLLNVPIQYVEELEEDDDVTIERVPDYIMHYLGWNNKLPIFQDKKVRQAIALAVDREPIIQTTLEGEGKAVYGPLPEVVFGYNQEIENKAQEMYSKDIHRAKELLTEAGWDEYNGDGVVMKEDEPFSVEMWVSDDPVSQRVAPILQNQLQEVGIKININVQESAAIIEQTPKGSHEMILWSFGWFDADVLYFLLFGEGRSTRLHYEDPYLNQLLLDARVEMDVDKRLDIYKEAQEFLLEESPWVPLYVRESIHATRGLDNFEVHPILNDIYWPGTRVVE